jgi:hypothetical protein
MSLSSLSTVAGVVAGLFFALNNFAETFVGAAFFFAPPINDGVT